MANDAPNPTIRLLDCTCGTTYPHSTNVSKSPFTHCRFGVPPNNRHVRLRNPRRRHRPPEQFAGRRVDGVRRAARAPGRARDRARAGGGIRSQGLPLRPHWEESQQAVLSGRDPRQSQGIEAAARGGGPRGPRGGGRAQLQSVGARGVEEGCGGGEQKEAEEANGEVAEKEEEKGICFRFFFSFSN